MTEACRREQAEEAMRRINQAWLSGKLEDLVPMVHPEMVMVYPGFAGRGQGREDILAGFRDFQENAAIHEYQERDLEADVAGDTAVVTFRFEMDYERQGKRYHCTGRDLWVFGQQDEAWVAVWRTMLDVEEHEV